MAMPNKKVVVLGAGAWGTALALALDRKADQSVLLWGRDPEHIQLLKETRHNPSYLPNVVLPSSLALTSDLDEALSYSSYAVWAVPSAAVRSLAERVASLTEPSRFHICLATKGLDPKALQFLHEVIRELLGEAVGVSVLSGPSFAQEVAQNKPTAVALASDRHATLQAFSEAFQQPTFRVYPTSDLIGVQLGGIVKNVLAIAAGISDGMQLGSNARAALLTRGLSEVLRLGAVLNAEVSTLMGLAGLGDLILTCCDDQSRNRRFGLAIGSGLTPQQASETIPHVIEGFQNAQCLQRLAEKHHIELPIVQQVHQILSGKITPAEALSQLLHRKSPSL